MNSPARLLRLMTFRLASAALGCALAVFSATAADTPPAISATDLAAKLSTLQQDGASYVRLRLEVKQPPGTTKTALQIQIKQRRTRNATEVVYQVLWPKERKGEGILLRKIGDRPATGSYFLPPDTVRTIEMKEPLFGSDLTCEDVIENFFAWEHQAIVGTEVVDRVNCHILESKPGKGQRFSSASVRTWVDTRRIVPLRVENYSASGEVLRRIDSTKVATDDEHRHIPANLSVRGRRQDSVTELDGSRIVHGVAYTDRDFTPEALKELTTPKAASK